MECPIIPRDLGPILDKLQLLLENLPNQLPLKPVTVPDASHYASLICFKPDDELVDLTGSKACALNVHLEHVLDTVLQEPRFKLTSHCCQLVQKRLPATTKSP